MSSPESNTYEFTAASATDVGLARVLNEDNSLIAGDLFAVAEGMGGHDSGEVASAMTVDTLAAGRAELDASAQPTTLSDLQRWLTEANRDIYQFSDGRAGTTLTLLSAVQHEEQPQLAVINIGDSRVYQLRRSTEEFRQLTEDHSAVQEMVRAGRLTAEAARVHPARNVITRAVGSNLRLAADVLLLSAEAGDRFLLCSDGLTSEVEDDDLAQILGEAVTPEEACQRLIARALELDGSDNITVVVVDVTRAPEAAKD